ncbi:hypothetical protein Y032_0103g3520 [Ancylostoma ceylanicum]|nr:hypothetical protein Y032_0103g3520 [Ancylostoma ceylanicum]
MSKVKENIKTKTIKNDNKQRNKGNDASAKTARLNERKANAASKSAISAMMAQTNGTPENSRPGKGDDIKTCIAPPLAQQAPQPSAPVAKEKDTDGTNTAVIPTVPVATVPTTGVSTPSAAPPTSSDTGAAQIAAEGTSATVNPTSATKTNQHVVQQSSRSKKSRKRNKGGTPKKTNTKPTTESEETSIVGFTQFLEQRFSNLYDVFPILFQSTSLETAKDISTIDPKEAAKYWFLNQPTQQKVVENPSKFGEESTMIAYKDFDLFEINNNNKPPDMKRLEEFFAITGENEEPTQQQSLTNVALSSARRPVEQSGVELKTAESRESKQSRKSRKKQKKGLQLRPSLSITNLTGFFKDKNKKKLKAKTQPTMQKT